MKNILLGLIIFNSFIFANKAYDISSEDYNKYKNNPEMMMKIFKNRFLKEKVEKVIIKTIVKDKKIEIIKPVVIKVTKIKVSKYYSYDEVNNKLKYNKLIEIKSIDKLLISINNILNKSKNKYNINEIKSIIKKIHKKRISKFESEIYLKQIKTILRDEI